ncbi:MAG: hypothetical protein ACI8QC_001809 [Planctomycetota bacterium]|jgi:hypothetical protein
MPLTAPFALVALLALALIGFTQLQLLRLAKDAGTAGGARTVAAILAVVGIGATGAASLGVAGAAGLAVVGTVLVEKGPVRRVSIERTSNFAQAADQETQGDFGSAFVSRAERSLGGETHALALTIDWAGDVSPSRVKRWLERECDLDVDLLNATPILDQGKTLTRLKFGVRMSERDLKDLEELEMALDLPAGLTVEINRR